jgi:ABC-type bacteriocin/lantibiotic exporter with double-glycine peptidase domain
MLGQFDDATLNGALRSAGLSSLQEDMDEGKLTLDSEIAAGGSNLSVGQRQIIALGEHLCYLASCSPANLTQPGQSSEGASS